MKGGEGTKQYSMLATLIWFSNISADTVLTWSLTLREEHAFRVLESKVVAKTCRPQADHPERRGIHESYTVVVLRNLCFLANVTERRDEWLAFLVRITEVLGSKLDPETSYAEGFRDFPKFL
jgi:hypothetical protein